MTAATVTKRIDVHNPNLEVVQLTVSSGETYTSQKFSRVTCASITPNEATATVPIAGTTGTTGVVTVTWTGASDLKATLVLYGNLGN